MTHHLTQSEHDVDVVVATRGSIMCIPSVLKLKLRRHLQIRGLSEVLIDQYQHICVEGGYCSDSCGN